MSGPHDTSARYERPGKAAAYRRRDHRRTAGEACLLEELLADVHLGLTLDAPCGGTRLAPLLRAHGARYVGLDRARAMLAEGQALAIAPLVRGDLAALPFADRAFDTVICFRFLHHLPPERQRAVLAELARVTGRHLAISAFHPLSAHQLQRRMRQRLGGRPPARWATAPRILDGWLVEVGFERRRARRQGVLRDLWLGLWARRDRLLPDVH